MSKMSLIHRVLAVATMAVVLSFGVPASADEHDDDRLDDAWMAALEDEEGLLTEQQFAMLNNIAYHAAVTKVCDGFELDQHKFAEGLEQAMTPTQASLSEDETREWANGVLILLGTRVGLLIAEGHAAEDDFCANATELKDTPEDVPHYWE